MMEKEMREKRPPIPDGFVTFSEALALSGMSKRTFQRRIESGELPSFRNPTNRKWRMIRPADIDQILQPEMAPVRLTSIRRAA